LFLFFLYIVVNAIIVSVEGGDVGIFLKEIGLELLSPLESAQEYLSELKQAPVGSFFGSLMLSWGFYYNLYKIYLWIRIILIPINFALRDQNAPLLRWGIAIVLFYFLQLIYLGFFTEKGPQTVFTATWEIIKGFPEVFIGIKNHFIN
jgi:hypothetical protein